jgi:hypothetical protein
VNIQLPPRRELPPEIKERMRPAFVRPSTRRRPWIVVAAAAVVLIVAGGVFVARSVHDQDPASIPDPAQPVDHNDLARCRIAVSDRDWTARYALRLRTRTVLLGTDSRICELLRSSVSVFDVSGVPAVRTPGGLVVGHPPVPVRSMSARMHEPSAGGTDRSPQSVATPELYLVDAVAKEPADAELILEFDDHPLTLPWRDIPHRGQSQTSFASRDLDRWSSVNLLARCLDHTVLIDRASPGYETDWQPAAMTTPLDSTRLGVQIAYNSQGEWGTCAIGKINDEPVAGTLTETVVGELTNYMAPMYKSWAASGHFVYAGRLDPSVAYVVLESPDGTQTSAPAPNAANSFAAQLSLRPGEKAPVGVKIALHGQGGELMYEGELTP